MHWRLAMLLLLGWSLRACALPAAWAGLAPDTLVVMGRHAPDGEARAAADVAAALHALGGPADNLCDDESALRDLNRTAFHHLVLVGTYSDNVVLRQQWGHDALDRPAFLREKALPTDAPRPPFYAGVPTTGFYVFGFGTFTKPGTGYLESGRNDLYLVPHALNTPQQPPYRIRVNITGNDATGVARAAAAFLRGELNGVLPAPEEALPAPGDAFRLARDRYGAELPAWTPTAGLLGWTQPNATEYAGFLQASGQAATLLWRAKYLPTAGVTDFDSSPHRRASADELLIARMPSADAARQAVAGFEQTLAAKPTALLFDTLTMAGQPVRHAGGLQMVAVREWVLLANTLDPSVPARALTALTGEQAR